MEEADIKAFKEYEKKQKKKKIKRAFLIVINAVLLCYFIFCIYDTCIEFFNKNFKEDDKILSINGYSSKKSLEIYDKFIDKVDDKYLTTNVEDFSFYGGYLSFKDCTNQTKEDGSLLISSFDTYYLQNVSTLNKFEKGITFQNDFENNNYINKGIFLFDNNIVEGDYIIYPYNYIYGTSEKVPLKINSQKGIHKTYYSPFINGHRKRIELKSKASSPCLLISVKNIYSNSSYDVSFLYQEDSEKDNLNDLFNDSFHKKFIAKSTTIENDIISLYEAHALVNIIVSTKYKEDITLSTYIEVDNSLYSHSVLDSYLKIYDEDPYIRELGGHIFNAGSGVKYENNTTKILSGYKQPFDEGSLTIFVRPTALDKLQVLLENLVNFNF